MLEASLPSPPKTPSESLISSFILAIRSLKQHGGQKVAIKQTTLLQSCYLVLCCLIWYYLSELLLLFLWGVKMVAFYNLTTRWQYTFKGLARLTETEKAKQ